MDKLAVCFRFGERFLLPMPRVCSLSIAAWCNEHGATNCRAEECAGEVATLVRHPFDRLVSAYYTRPPGSIKEAPLFWAATMPFEQFVEELPVCADIHVRPQTELAPRLSFFGRFENLVDDWSKLCAWLGARHRPLPHRHKSHEREAREHFTPRTRRLAEDFYAADFAAFGY